jgi:hypothetical protein
MATTTNYSWTTPDDTDLVKDGAAAIRTLGSSIDTSVKALSPGTTAGDIDYYTTSTAKARVGIGTAGQILRVNSGATAPEWATPAAGGITLISETVASAASAINLTGIPATYKHLLFVWNGLQHTAGTTSFSLRLNNDSSAIYSNISVYNETSAASSFQASNTDTFALGNSVFGNTSTGSSVNQAPAGYLWIYDYASTSKFKRYNGHAVYWKVSNTRYDSWNGVGTYRSTSAITSIDIYRASGAGNLTNIADTSILLYGVS